MPESAVFFVSRDSGNDGNDGSEAHPLRTIPAAVAKCPMGCISNIYVEHSAQPYSEPIDVTYYRGVNLIAAAGQKPIIRAVSNGINLILAQDHAMIGITRFQIDAPGTTGVNLFHQRQFTISDLVDCDWGPAPGGTMISVTDPSTCNVSGWTIKGGARCLVSASRRARVIAAGWLLHDVAGLTFEQLLEGDDGSIDLSSGTFAGAGGNVGTNGRQWALRNGSKLYKPGAYPVPGNPAGNIVDAASIMV